jgi:hypothetical protein
MSHNPFLHLNPTLKLALTPVRGLLIRSQVQWRPKVNEIEIQILVVLHELQYLFSGFGKVDITSKILSFPLGNGIWELSCTGRKYIFPLLALFFSPELKPFSWGIWYWFYYKLLKTPLTQVFNREGSTS